ncbi:hypothetical protein [Terrihabitans sp. B22-R8]|uniref:hypothetical protein n=1 Tax=Terrihabitans sp. B22-R8 TaxID=3425128 RepID=UPI00403CC839
MNAKNPGGGQTPMETAKYVAELTAELATLARGSGLDVIGYLLDLARLEAEETARNHGQGRAGHS